MQDPMMTTEATGRQIAKGAAWMMGFKLLDKCIGLASIFVLAHVLTPADFGLVAMAMSVVTLLELMGAFGFDTALIQRQDAERRHFDTAWTFNIIFSAGVAIMLLVLAVPAADFYHEPRLEMMLPLLAGSALIAGFENIGTVAFRKELDFGKEFRFLIAKRLAAVAVTVPLALAFRSFWALVAGIVTGKVMAVIISYRLHPYRPRLSLAARSDLMHFSKWLFISNLIQFLQSRSTDFILGRIVGSHGLGVYKMATEIATMPSTEMIAPLNRAVYPAYAQLSSDGDRLRTRFFEVYGIINLLAFPVAVGLFCVSGLVVSVALGKQWQEAVPIIQIAGLSGLLSALQSNLIHVMIATGKPKANTLLQAGLLLVSLPAVLLASMYFGTVGAAFAQMGAAALGTFGAMAVFSRIAHVPVRRLLATMWRPFLASALMALMLGASERLLESLLPNAPRIAQLAIQVCVGVLSYCGSILALWAFVKKPTGPEQALLAAARERILSIRRARIKIP